MDIFELAKQAKAAKANGDDAPPEDPAKVIARLKRKLDREKRAREAAEKTIEESSRNLYLSNRTLDATNEQLETTVLELNETMARLTSAEVKRLATTITLVLAALLFFVSEFAIEPVLERSINNRLQLAVAKVSIFSVLIPIEILVSRYIESNLSEAEHLNEDMYMRTASSRTWSEPCLTAVPNSSASRQMRQSESKMKLQLRTPPERRALSKFFCTR